MTAPRVWTSNMAPLAISIAGRICHRCRTLRAVSLYLHRGHWICGRCLSGGDAVQPIAPGLLP